MPLTHYITAPARIRARSGIVYHTEQERRGMLAARPTDPLNALAEQHRVRQARENIRAGTYDEPGVVGVVVDRVLAVIE